MPYGEVTNLTNVAQAYELRLQRKRNAPGMKSRIDPSTYVVGTYANPSIDPFKKRGRKNSGYGK